MFVFLPKMQFLLNLHGRVTLNIESTLESLTKQDITRGPWALTSTWVPLPNIQSMTYSKRLLERLYWLGLYLYLIFTNLLLRLSLVHSNKWQRNLPVWNSIQLVQKFLILKIKYRQLNNTDTNTKLFIINHSCLAIITWLFKSPS